MALMPRANRPVDETVLDRRGQWPLILGFFVLLFVAGISAWLTFDNRRQNVLVAHTLEVESTANEFFISVQGAETGQRGYLLALQPEYDDRYRSAALRRRRLATRHWSISRATTLRNSVVFES